MKQKIYPDNKKKDSTGSPSIMNQLDYSTERVPPQALDVERTVLGAMIIDSDCTSIAVEQLTENSFYLMANRTVFITIADMFEKNINVDPVTLAEELRKNGSMGDIGGEPYLGEIAEAVATSANMEYYCAILLEKETARSLIKSSAEITNECYGSKNRDE